MVKTHKHKLPSGKTYYHPILRRHRAFKKVVKKIRLIPRKEGKFYRVTLGRSYAPISDISDTTPKPFLTIYSWTITEDPDSIKESELDNLNRAKEKDLFKNWTPENKAHWKDNVEVSNSFNPRNVDLSEMHSATGLEVQKLPIDEVIGDKDAVYTSAVFFDERGSPKERY